MFEKFTEKAIKVMMLAQEESRRLSHNFVGTEQMLLGLIGEGTGIAAKALKMMGVNLKDARKETEKIIGRGSGFVAVEIPFTPRAKKVLEFAWDEARHLSNSHIGPEHLLLGLLKEREGVANRVLENMAVDPERLRSEVLKLVSKKGETPTGKSARRGSYQKTPLLDEFCQDVTERARDGKLDPVVGRHKEIERVMQIIGRRTKNNPVLLGEPGVGKTAIAEGLALRIASSDVPESLKDKRICLMDIGLLVAGTKYRGEFEDRLKKLMDEVKSTGNIILVIDEIHNLIGAGAAEGAIDAANILKPALSRGDLQCIGATTLDEYRKHIERDSALERRFQPIIVDPPSVEETIEILEGLRPKYEEHHKLVIDNAALTQAARLSDRYISDRFLPDKAVDLMDEASSRVRLRASSLSPAGKKLEKRIRELRQKKEEAIRSQDFENGAALREKESKLREKLLEMKSRAREKEERQKPVVSAEEITQVVSTWTGVPLAKLTETESERLLSMSDELHKRVVGQNEAVDAISKAIRRSRVGLKNPHRPIGSFIFSGPTGVGKTELAKTLADYYFGSEETLIRVDMSEFMEQHTTSKLMGAPPGYVGYDEGGQLTEQVRRKPYSVVLFDEIEKAHPDVFNALLQILDDGRLSDSRGRTVDFKNTIIIMTSNVGAQYITKSNLSLGFQSATSEDTAHSEKQKKIKDLVLDAMKKTFRPEFLNRIDEIVVFQQLTRDEIRRIVDLLSGDLQKRVELQGMELQLTDECKDLIAKDGYKPEYGARPLRRAIQNHLEDALAEQVLQGLFKPGDVIEAKVEDETISFLKAGTIKSGNGSGNGSGKSQTDDSEQTGNGKSSKKRKESPVKQKR